MKNIFRILIFSLVALTSCEKNDEKADINCESLTQGLISMESDVVSTELEKLTVDLSPNPNAEDQYGHSENIELLVSELNQQCENLQAELACYACIKTYPPQSTLLISINSSGIIIKRVIDISTPKDDVMKYADIHKLDSETTKEQDAAMLEERYAEILTLSQSVNCDNPDDWTFTAIGSKACGGPANYIAYSKKIDTTAFLNLVEEFTLAQAIYNVKWGIMSDCTVTPKPVGVDCKDGKAILIY
ncbi:MAG: hypothetical protein ABFR62_14220 [Bacteroidota bacterium]